MAQLLQHQDSCVSYGKDFHGCRWSILQFFGFRRRLRYKKMLSGNKTKGSYVPLDGEDGNIMDDDKNFQVTNKHKTSKRNTGKANLRTLILRKLYRKQGQKQKMLPVGKQLLRTISIHYLECNDYVRGEITSESDASSINLSGTGSSGHGEHPHVPNRLDKPLLEGELSKSHSSKHQHKWKETDLFHQGEKSSNADVQVDAVGPEKRTLDGYGPRGNDPNSLLFLERDDRIGENHILKKRIKDVFNEDKRGRHRTSMDGVLHRVPYGQKLSEEVIKEKLFRSASATCDRDGSRGSIGSNRQPNQSFRRSHSLSESLERYTHLLDSISSGESKRLTRSSKSTKDHSSLDSNVTITFQRINSSPEFRSKSLIRHTQNEEIPESLSSLMPDSSVLDGDVKIATNENFSAVIANCPEDLQLRNECGSSETYKVSEPSKEDVCTFPLQDVELPEQQVPQSCEVSNSIECTSHVILYKQGIAPEADSSCEPDKARSISFLDPGFSDASVSPVKHRILEDSKLEPRGLHFDGADALANVDALYVDESSKPPSNASTCNNEHQIVPANFDAFKIQVDQKNEAEFTYVKDVFEKSNFSSEELFDAWYSHNMAALQEEDCQPYEVPIAALDFNDMSVDQADQLLLFDLINEVLLEIYKKSSVHKTKFSRFASCNRPKPVGRHVLKDLWSGLSWHLNANAQSSFELDNVVALNFKGDGWVNFQRESDHFGRELVDFVMDKLLHELTFELVNY